MRTAASKVWWVACAAGEDDTSRLHSAAGAGQREERRPAGHGPHSQLPQTTQPAPSLRPHERRPSSRVRCTASAAFEHIIYVYVRLNNLTSASVRKKLTSVDINTFDITVQPA